MSPHATIEQTLIRLQRSAFRARFHLADSDRRYIAAKGMDTIQRHAADFIRTRLAPANPKNDGRQTPMRGHPVFLAQHACACCCRGCLNKWYRIPMGRSLTENEQERIVRLLMAWIERELERAPHEGRRKNMTQEEYQAAANFWKAKERVEMPDEQLRPAVEAFLSGSSVCALATGNGHSVRCTPLEYSYHNGRFWIFTEGGEKFIGLAENRSVSLAVFDQNPNFGQLRSVQVTGTAALIEPMSDAYIAHAEYKKVPLSALKKLADQGQPMHLLCITPERADVLFSEFKAQGYDSRQELLFPLPQEDRPSASAET